MNINSESLNFYKFVTRHTLNLSKWDDLKLKKKTWSTDHILRLKMTFFNTRSLKFQQGHAASHIYPVTSNTPQTMKAMKNNKMCWMHLHIVNTHVKHEGYKDRQIQTVCFALREKPLLCFTFYYLNLFIYNHLIIFFIQFNHNHYRHLYTHFIDLFID